MKVKFLEQRPNEVFELQQERHDETDVDPKWVFHRSTRVIVQRRKGFSIEDLDVIRKKYSEEKRKYLLKEKVSSGCSISRKKCSTIYNCQFHFICSDPPMILLFPA